MLTVNSHNRKQRVDLTGLTSFVNTIASLHPMNELTFLCIGTDRSTGDSLGPWVGTLLEQRGFTNVIGTLKNPCDAHRLPQWVESIKEETIVVAIDACLGRPESVGMFLTSEGPIFPGQSVTKGLPPVGNYSIAAIVNETGPKPYNTLQTTSLYEVMNRATEIADVITEQFKRG
ncbi:MAG: spore protease YyaC [Candidatus Cohnella colombiensis]|uniref:Spore protease YyaC n=1 Tax=Candidatus Cohnella colombiensis TaxID=3121368 RepID=A0AA95JDN5_9BACL|nr:MAG: spore protease YyaC [Cohnella sp.]